MWCRQCNIETNEKQCPVCGSKTTEDYPVILYWCNDCRIPIIHTSISADKGTCPCCGHKTRRLTSDLRPVFPEERLLFALLVGLDPDLLMEQSVWAINTKYYIDGTPYNYPLDTYAKADAYTLLEQLSQKQDCIDYTFFNQIIRAFIDADRLRLDCLKDEAFLLYDSSCYNK